MLSNRPASHTPCGGPGLTWLRSDGALCTNVFNLLKGSLLALAALMNTAHAEISDQEIRQLFIVSGEQPTRFEYGGVVLFKAAFDGGGDACKFKNAHPNTTIFVDQEGGKVIRVAAAPLPSPQKARAMNNQELYREVKLSAKKLKTACIDANLAPVVEVSDDQGRSYGTTPEEIIPKATAFSLAMQSEGIKTVLKHFPGWNEHCERLTDLSHIKLSLRPNSEASRCHVHENERDEFLAKAKAFGRIPSDAWMVSNHITDELGPYPNVMNPTINELARTKLGYKGLLISDALWEIEASPKAVLMALKVVDWVMIGYSSQAEIALPVIKAGLKNGFFTEDELRGKLARIEMFKASHLSLKT